MLKLFAFAATVCVSNVSVCVCASLLSRVCACVPAVAAAARRVCVTAVTVAAAAASRSPSERPAAPDVGEQLSPQRGCEPRSPPAEALRTDGRHACDGRSASRPSQGSARDAQQAKTERSH